MVDNLPLKIMMKDENNVVLLLNAPAAVALGGSVSDFEGKNVYNIFPYKAKIVSVWGSRSINYHKAIVAYLHNKKEVTIW